MLAAAYDSSGRMIAFDPPPVLTLPAPTLSQGTQQVIAQASGITVPRFNFLSDLTVSPALLVGAVVAGFLIFSRR